SAYSSRRTSRAWRTAGVTQPAQTLSRGKRARSRTTTSRPLRARRHAQLDPAGPPPTTRTSQVVTTRTAAGLPPPPPVQVGPRPRDVVLVRAREGDLEELQPAGGERGLGSGQVQPPGAHEGLVE